MPDRKGRLSPKEALWAEHMALTGDAHEAARRAGYAESNIAAAASVNSRDPVVMAHASTYAAKRYSTLYPMAFNKLESALAPNSTWSERVQMDAAKFVITQVGDERSRAEATTKDLSDMTPEEINESLRLARDELARRPTRAKDITPEQPNSAQIARAKDDEPLDLLG